MRLDKWLVTSVDSPSVGDRMDTLYSNLSDAKKYALQWSKEEPESNISIYNNEDGTYYLDYFGGKLVRDGWTIKKPNTYTLVGKDGKRYNVKALSKKEAQEKLDKYLSESLDELLVEKIIKKSDGYYVTSEDGKKNLGGPYKKIEDAEKRLGQVEYFKNKKKIGEDMKNDYKPTRADIFGKFKRKVDEFYKHAFEVGTDEAWKRFYKDVDKMATFYNKKIEEHNKEFLNSPNHIRLANEWDLIDPKYFLSHYDMMGESLKEYINLPHIDNLFRVEFESAKYANRPPYRKGINIPYENIYILADSINQIKKFYKNNLLGKTFQFGDAPAYQKFGKLLDVQEVAYGNQYQINLQGGENSALSDLKSGTKLANTLPAIKLVDIKLSESLDEDFPWEEESGFFTREDIDEFTSELQEVVPTGVEIHRGFFEPGNMLEVDWSYQDYEETSKMKIDMRKIKLPSDLIKRYLTSFKFLIDSRVNEIAMELGESLEESYKDNALPDSLKNKIVVKEFNLQMVSPYEEDIPGAVLVIPNGYRMLNGSTVDASVEPIDEFGHYVNFSSVREAEKWLREHKEEATLINDRDGLKLVLPEVEDEESEI